MASRSWRGQSHETASSWNSLYRRPAMKLSARNVLKGTIVEKRCHDWHIKIDVGGQIITSTITNEAVDELRLAKGQSAYAVVKASDVMIAIDWLGSIQRWRELGMRSVTVQLLLVFALTLSVKAADGRTAAKSSLGPSLGNGFGLHHQETRASPLASIPQWYQAVLSVFGSNLRPKRYLQRRLRERQKAKRHLEALSGFQYSDREASTKLRFPRMCGSTLFKMAASPAWSDMRDARTVPGCESRFRLYCSSATPHTTQSMISGWCRCGSSALGANRTRRG